MTCTLIENGIVCSVPVFKEDDMPPKGYLAWHEWARVQHKAGLRQVKCGLCGLFKFPQELGDFVVESKYQQTKTGPQITRTDPICKECEPFNLQPKGL